MSRAPTNKLEELHGVLADAFRSEITKQRPEEAPDIPAALLAAAANFLKTNGITSIPTKDNPLGRLMEAVDLPFTDDPSSDRVN